MNSLILLGSIQCLIMLLLLFSKKEKSSADYVLIALLGYFTTIFGFIYYTQEFNKGDLTAYLLNAGLLIAALFTIYIQKLLDGKRGFNKSNYLHFVPYLLTSVFLLIYFFISRSVNSNIKSYYDFIHFHNWIHNSFRYINIALGPIYMVVIVLIFRRHKKNITQIFSSTEKLQLAWVRNIALLAFLIWFFTAIIGKLGKYYLFPQFSRIYELTWGLSALLFVYITYKGFKYRSVFFDIPNEPESNDIVIQSDNTQELSRPSKYGRSGLKEQDFEQLAKKVNEYIEIKKPYLNNQLTIYDFASALSIPPYQLSQLLNEYYKLNFYDFINKFRVEEFKKQALLPENKNYSIQAIAFDCGFNSKSTFFRIFKAQTHQTPSQFIEKNRINL